MARQGGCPICNCKRTTVVKTMEKTIKWRGKSRDLVRRYRRCNNCRHQWFSLELTEDEVSELLSQEDDDDSIETDIV